MSDEVEELLHGVDDEAGMAEEARKCLSSASHTHHFSTAQEHKNISVRTFHTEAGVHIACQVVE